MLRNIYQSTIEDVAENMEEEQKRKLKGKVLGFSHGFGYIVAVSEGNLFKEIYTVYQMDVIEAIDKDEHEIGEVLKEGDEVEFDSLPGMEQKVAVNVKVAKRSNK